MLFGNTLTPSYEYVLSVLVLNMVEKNTYLLCIPMSAVETNQRNE